MATKTIETKAIVSAQDRTGGTFAQVAAKLRSLESTAAQATRRMDRLASGMSAVGAKAREHQDIARRMSMAAPVAAAAGGRFAAIRGRIRDGMGDFASYAAPGAVGGALGLGGAAVGGLAVGGASAYALHQAISFEKAMADVKKKVTLDQGATWADVEKMINSAARNTGIARESVAALAAQAGQAGVSYKDLAGFIDTASKASSAWDVDAKETAQTLSEIRAQTGWNNKELETYADKVNYLGDISAAAEKNISEMWARASAGAKAAGISYDDSMAVLTAMRSVGMDPDVASRGLGQIASKLRTATTLPKDAQAAIKSLGMTPKQIEQGMKSDGAGTLVKVLDALGKAKDGTKVSQALFGKEWYDEALRMKDALAEIVRLRKELASGNWRGSLGKAQEMGLSTTQSHIDRFKNLASEVGDRVGREVLPTVNSFLDYALNKYDKFGAGYWNPLGGIGSAWDKAGETPFDRMRRMKAGGADMAKALGVSPSAPGFDSYFAARKGTGWAGGTAAASVAPGLLGFGGTVSRQSATSGIDAMMKGGAPVIVNVSPTSFGDASALNRAPSLVQNIMSPAAGAGVVPAAKLEGTASIGVKVEVTPSPDFVVKVSQQIDASGALRADTGVSMPQ